MSDIERTTDALDAERVRRTWAWARDGSDWDLVRSCFHDDAVIEVSWLKGSVADFIAQARELALKRRPEERGKHWLGNARSWVNGDRALVETDAHIEVRIFLDGYLFDCTTWVCFFDLVERRAGVWRILHWYCFFDKDRLDPVIPGSVPAEFFNDVDVSGAESSIAFTRFRHRKAGRRTVDDVIIGRSEAERTVRLEAESWLAQQTTSERHVLQ